MVDDILVICLLGWYTSFTISFVFFFPLIHCKRIKIFFIFLHNPTIAIPFNRVHQPLQKTLTSQGSYAPSLKSYCVIYLFIFHFTWNFFNLQKRLFYFSIFAYTIGYNNAFYTEAKLATSNYIPHMRLITLFL